MERLWGRHLAAMLIVSSSDTRIRRGVLHGYTSGLRVISRRGVGVFWDIELCSREVGSVMLPKY